MKSPSKKRATILYSVFMVCSIIVLFSTKIPPHKFWMAGIIAYLIPVTLLSHALFIVYRIFKKSFVFAIPSCIILLLSYEYIHSIFPIHFDSKQSFGKQITVLSYNASFFHNKGRWQEGYDSFIVNYTSIAMKNWLINNDADIKCIQEFYNHDDSDIYNNIRTISKNGLYDQYFSKSRKNRPRIDWNYGLAIFSKYPIINTGEIIFSNNAYNKGAYADIAINCDTIRVINVHLQSMGLDQTANHGFIAKGLSLFRKIKYGMVARSQQVEVLQQYIAASPYKVVICGDMNELPHSYVYRKFKSLLNNAFEEVGSGFGMTYNLSPLFFLRIDHQFSDPSIKALRFKTFKEVAYSDNFPIQVTYALEN